MFNKRKGKSLFLKIIKHMPSNSVRIFLLEKIFGYSIGKNVKIGKVIINCNKVTIGDNVYIADNNIILCNELSIGQKTSIHSGNVFQGSANFYIGTNSRIINNHYFDLHHNIEIGNNTWIAGKGSQFWTHGSIHTKLNTKDLSIKIKNDIYIGSASCFAPGVFIESENLIGLGSVIIKSFLKNKTIIAGNPAVVVKQDVDWRINW
jgi:acetyltransferase-like isoleucine patch superfamily enzyme